MHLYTILIKKNREFRLALMLTGYNPITPEVKNKYYHCEHIRNEGIVMHKLL